MAWDISDARAARLMLEYHRFRYLVASTPEVLAPSRAVDVVWHLHLNDPPAYRGAFERDVIGRHIQHHEGRPPPRKDPAHLRTRQRYRAECGTAPFAKVWQNPDCGSRPWTSICGLIAILLAAIGVNMPSGGLILLAICLGLAVAVHRWMTAPWRFDPALCPGGCGSRGRNDSNDADGGCDDGDGGGYGGD